MKQIDLDDGGELEAVVVRMSRAEAAYLTLLTGKQNGVTSEAVMRGGSSLNGKVYDSLAGEIFNRFYENGVDDVVAAQPRETDQELHARGAHPAWEYRTTEGPRKQWDDQDVPPRNEEGEPDLSWERNVDMGRDGWDRFDYTEESYWRRRKP
ncbi:hypothetical protein ACGFU4_36230 [Streptomyces sp. NPDC048511]|uniref:hypothetical protein n=1 Tax=Streptomyces sp. NPDC048511 TaxID=3365562 RepID=UPI00371AE4A2